MYDEDSDEEERKPIKLPLTLHFTQGNKCLRLQKFENAKDYFNIVLSEDTVNIKALLGVCRSLAGLGKLKEAKVVVQNALKLAPTNNDAIYLEGDLNYLEGDFEKGLISLHTAAKANPMISSLRLSYQTCEKALDNALGPGGVLALDDIDVEQIEKLLKGDRENMGQKFCKRRFEPHFITEDMNFLTTIRGNKNMSKFHLICEDLLSYLGGRKKFWRMQNPRRKRRPTKPKNPKWSQEEEILDQDPQTLYEIACIKCIDCQATLKEGNAENSLKIGLEALAILEYFSYYNTLQIIDLKAKIYHHIGLAHLLKGDSVSAFYYFERERELGTSINMPVIKQRALLCIGEIYFRHKTHRKAITYFNRCLALGKLKSHSPIVLYKVADCHMNLDHLEQATNYADKSLEAATIYNDHRIQLDSTLLLAEISVKYKKLDEAIKLYEKAFSIASRDSDARKEDIEHLIHILKQPPRNDSQYEKIKRFSSKLDPSKCTFANSQQL